MLKLIRAVLTKAGGSIFVILFSIYANQVPTEYTSQLVVQISYAMMLETLSRFGTDNLVITDVRANQQSTFAASQTILCIAIISVSFPVLLLIFEQYGIDVAALALAFALSAALSNYKIGRSEVFTGILFRGVGPYALLFAALLVQEFVEIKARLIAVAYLVLLVPYAAVNLRHQFVSLPYHFSEIKKCLIRPSLIVISLSNSSFTNILVVFSSNAIIGFSITEANLIQRIGNAAASLATLVFWAAPKLVTKKFWKTSLPITCLAWSLNYFSYQYAIFYSDVIFASVSLILFQISVGMARVYDYEARNYVFLALEHMAALALVMIFLSLMSVAMTYFFATIILLALRILR